MGKKSGAGAAWKKARARAAKKIIRLLSPASKHSCLPDGPWVLLEDGIRVPAPPRFSKHQLLGLYLFQKSSLGNTQIFCTIRRDIILKGQSIIYNNKKAYLYKSKVICYNKKKNINYNAIPIPWLDVCELCPRSHRRGRRPRSRWGSLRNQVPHKKISLESGESFEWDPWQRWIL